jgi:hypothetical protein
MEWWGKGESVQFADVQVIRDTGLAWLCLIHGKRVAVPRRLILDGTTVSWPGARHGKVVIPKSLAVTLGLR